MAVVEVTANPKIKDLQSGAMELKSFIQNPPKTPYDAMKFFISTGGLGVAVKGLSGIPGIGALSSILSLVDVFSGGPSIGELTLDAIGQVSEQIAAGVKQLTQEIQTQTEAARTATIDAVLSGVDEVAREQSAVGVIQALTASTILTDEAAAFSDIRAASIASLEETRGAILDELKSKADAIAKEIDGLYNEYVLQIAQILAELAPYLLEAFNATLNQLTAPALVPDAVAVPRSVNAEGVTAPKAEQTEQSLTIPLIGAGFLLFFLMRKKT